jgi:hypothetical protein
MLPEPTRSIVAILHDVRTGNKPNASPEEICRLIKELEAQEPTVPTLVQKIWASDKAMSQILANHIEAFWSEQCETDKDSWYTTTKDATAVIMRNFGEFLGIELNIPKED